MLLFVFWSDVSQCVVIALVDIGRFRAKPHTSLDGDQKLKPSLCPRKILDLLSPGSVDSEFLSFQSPEPPPSRQSIVWTSKTFVKFYLEVSEFPPHTHTHTWSDKFWTFGRLSVFVPLSKPANFVWEC